MVGIYRALHITSLGLGSLTTTITTTATNQRTFPALDLFLGATDGSKGPRSRVARSLF